MADMYLVTCEDNDGMWFDDPIAGYSADEARAIARKKWPTLHHSKALILYRCSQVEEVATVQTNTDQPRIAMTAPVPAGARRMSEDQKTSQAALRAQEVQALAEFARYIISEYCWGDSEPDSIDVQDVAERLGLIEPHIATAGDAEEHTDFGPGDTIYKFATWLNQPRGLSAGEAPSAETVNLDPSDDKREG